jgi:preprotein translocase subunit SecF
MIISSIISILIIWSGDFSAQLQFDGPLKSEIKGELVEGNKTCEVYGRFDEVMIKEKNQLEKFIKANFRFTCMTDKQPQETQLATEVIRASDLKTHSSNVFISNQFKKNTLKIENYSIQISKKPSKTSGK